jgi:hypothetical protein
VTERRGRSWKQLLDDLKEKRGYRKLKYEALDYTLWRTRFGRGYGPVLRQTTEGLYERDLRTNKNYFPAQHWTVWQRKYTHKASCEHVPACRTDGRLSPGHLSSRLNSSAPGGGESELFMFSPQGGFTVLITNISTASREDGSHVPYGWEQKTHSVLIAWFTFDQIWRNNQYPTFNIIHSVLRFRNTNICTHNRH